jgi:hypothetical protein
LASRSLAVVAWLLLSIEVAGGDWAFTIPQSRSLQDRVQDYIARFEREASALVAEEHYVQRLVRGGGESRVETMRELRSDYVLVKPADNEPWLGYRDIYEVDGMPVRERDARIVRILSTTAPDSGERAMAFAREGSRFNLGPERTVNTPTLPHQLLAKANASRFRFRIARGWQRQTISEIQFEERERPTLVRTVDGMSIDTHGTLRVRVSDGAILGARLRFRFT